MGALTAVAVPGQSQFCSMEMILFPWRLLKDAFNFFLFLPFKIPFYFIITIFFFLPREEQRKEERRKLIKQSPNAKHLAVSLWILIVAPALTGWGLLLRRSGGEPSSQRSGLPNLTSTLCPHTSVVPLFLFLCPLPLPPPPHSACLFLVLILA